jgi:5-methylthioribose kinase
LTAANAAQYLAALGMSDPQSVAELGGGVSNTVLMVRMAEGRLVLKQSLSKLRVEQEWFSDPARIFREAEALRWLAPCLPPGSVPMILFDDGDNFIIAMSSAPAEAVTWKAQLLRGDIRPEIAGRIGELLAAIIRAGWRDAAWESRFGDQKVFDQLRLDPYYRSIARVHPELAEPIANLMRDSTARRVSMVHGDWSPKNFLVRGDEVMAIDFEVVHFGDPSFDVAFLLNHLALKAIARPVDTARYRAAASRFWESLAAGLPDGCEWLEEAALAHLGALMLARVDGKSPVEYLGVDSWPRVRNIARGLILSPPAKIAEVFNRL